jgi:hypothetical protein
MAEYAGTIPAVQDTTYEFYLHKTIDRLTIPIVFSVFVYKLNRPKGRGIKPQEIKTGKRGETPNIN